METEIFTCKYFKFGRNTTGLSQSHLRNFLACSIRAFILQAKKFLKCDHRAECLDIINYS